MQFCNIADINFPHLKKKQFKFFPLSPRFELEGDGVGSQGAAAQFEGRVVVMGAENNFYTLEMSSSLSGQRAVEVFDTDYQVMLVVASVPDFFGSYQTYGYQVKITKT